MDVDALDRMLECYSAFFGIVHDGSVLSEATVVQARLELCLLDDGCWSERSIPEILPEFRYFIQSDGAGTQLRDSFLGIGLQVEEAKLVLKTAGPVRDGYGQLLRYLRGATRSLRCELTLGFAPFEGEETERHRRYALSLAFRIRAPTGATHVDALSGNVRLSDIATLAASAEVVAEYEAIESQGDAHVRDCTSEAVARAIASIWGQADVAPHGDWKLERDGSRLTISDTREISLVEAYVRFGTTFTQRIGLPLPECLIPDAPW